MRSHFYAIAKCYQAWSRQYGRKVWGIKHQIRRVEGFSSFLRLLPQAHYIFIERSILDRSEEHTSELQSLMRISYAVFCLQKKTIINIQRIYIPLNNMYS